MKLNKVVLTTFTIIVVLFSFFQNCQKVKFQEDQVDQSSESANDPITQSKKGPSFSPSTLSTSSYVNETSEWLTFTLNNPTEDTFKSDNISIQFSNAKTSFKLTDFENNFRDAKCNDGSKLVIKPKGSCEFKIRFKPSIVGNVEIKLEFYDTALDQKAEAKLSAVSASKPVTPVNGACNPNMINKQIATAPNATNGCAAGGGIFSGLTNDATSYSWKCLGTNGTNASCSASYTPRAQCVPRDSNPRPQHVKDFMMLDLNGNMVPGTFKECYDTNAAYPVNGGINCVENQSNGASGCCPTGTVGINRACITKANLGENCFVTEACVENGYCNNGKCQNSGEFGPCKSNMHCASGLTCRLGTCER